MTTTSRSLSHGRGTFLVYVLLVLIYLSSRYDAFTHASTSQFSLAFEKASVIFNISAILSCHAASQSRADDTGLKTAYHSFQASAGMFTYINQNFLYPPSTDLKDDTIKTLINVTLAQAQEVFFEKQVADQRKAALLAKLAGQAAYLYSQAAEIMQNFVDKNVFDKVWTIVVQAKAAHMGSVASYYQAVADSESGSHGIAIARLQMADKQSATALSWAKTFPSSPPVDTGLTAESSSIIKQMSKLYLPLWSKTMISSTTNQSLTRLVFRRLPGLLLPKRFRLANCTKDKILVKSLGQTYSKN